MLAQLRLVRIATADSPKVAQDGDESQRVKFIGQGGTWPILRPKSPGHFPAETAMFHG
jgi:hypothetical protein